MRYSWIMLGVAFMVCGPVWADSPQEAFVAARDAYKAPDDKALQVLADRLQADNYPLLPYLDYWRILLRLDQASPADVRAVMARNADVPFSMRLRAEWLKKLGKRGEWQTFFEELPQLTIEDAAVSCYALAGRAEQGDAAALQDGRRLWLSVAEQPAACDALFDRMQQAGSLTSDDIWQRVRGLLAEGKISVAKAALRRLPQFDAATLKWVDKAYENPQRVLEKKSFSPKSRLGRELNLYALERVSRSQPGLALDLWKAQQGHYAEEDQRYLWGRFALHAARRHDPAALGWFRQAGDAPLTDEQLAWKARAALRSKQWPQLLDTIAGMPAPLQEDPAWRYWRGRALKEQAQIPAANAVLVPLSRERSYYGLLANEELGDVLAAPGVRTQANEEEVRAVQGIPGIQRALELMRVDMRWEARNEWAWATQGFGDRQLIAAAELAFRQEWYDVAIITAEKTSSQHDFALRYPTPYRSLMQAYARENDLDEAWVYGLIRQESRFISRARSSVGASGLMQLMPATAKWIARRIGLADYHNGMINQLDTNIQFGTHYMRYVLDQMSGQALAATAAYNAGPSRARKWMGGSAQPLEGAIYAETIPFTETRDYVKKVMGNAWFYSHQLGTRLQTLKQRLGTIAAGGAAMAADEQDIQGQQEP